MHAVRRNRLGTLVRPRSGAEILTQPGAGVRAAGVRRELRLTLLDDTRGPGLLPNKKGFEGCVPEEYPAQSAEGIAKCQAFWDEEFHAFDARVGRTWYSDHKHTGEFPVLGQ